MKTTYTPKSEQERSEFLRVLYAIEEVVVQLKIANLYESFKLDKTLTERDI